MAAVVASKPQTTATKMKKPSLPAVQTGTHPSKPGHPSASPSSAAKRLPGQTTPQSATNGNSAAINGTSRPNRRLQRLSTRTGTSDAVSVDKKAAAKRTAEPYVQKGSFILKKFKGRPPSLIVHLHPTHFRFDQQDGSFSYASDMKFFIKHLQDKTIPHDMLEELRSQDVQFYDGWLIVKVVDHKTLAADANRAGSVNDDEKPFSIHNHNNFITPSPYAPYPTKDQRLDSIKQERQSSVSKDTLHSDLRSDDTIDVMPKNVKQQPKVFHVALAPTLLSREMDMIIDARAPDPKTLNRKQSQVGSRTPGGGQPSTPIGGIPTTPSSEKPPPAKRQKTKIDPKDLIEFEARIVNATAPPLFLDLVDDEDQAKQLLDMMEDEWHNAAPPSPKSRKRTVAELAADDAHAKEQENFMLVMDERNVGHNTALNAGSMEGQTGATLFQPRFEKFNALDNIKRDIAEKKAREKSRQVEEDEARRGQQQQEEERRRMAIAQQQAERRRQAIQAQAQAQAQQAQQAQQQHVQALAAQRQQAQRAQQVNGIPPQMQNPMAATQASSPVIRHGTPHAASSPVVNNAQGGHAMVPSGSQQGQAGSPQRPGSALQHGHPGVAMARGPSNQGGPSRNGTPQLGHNTPGMRNATPVMRQGTPNQHMTQASPHGSMAAPTPQMNHAGMMGVAQIQNGMQRQQLTPQQAQQIHAQRIMAQQQQQHQQQQALQQHQQQQQQMMNGGRPQVSQAEIAQLRAQQQAQQDQQNAAVQRMQQQQAAMQHGTPQNQHMSASPAATQGYKEQLAAQMKAQMQNVSNQVPNQGSPAPVQMMPQQQQQMLQRQQQQQQMMVQQQQQQMGQQAGQVQRPMNPQMQAIFAQAQNAAFRQLMLGAAAKYGGNMNMIPPQEKLNLQVQAQQQARNHLAQKSRQMQAQAQMQRLQQQQAGGMGGGAQVPNGMVGTPGGGGGQINPNMAQLHQQQVAQQMQAMQLQQAQNMMQQQAQAQQGGNMGMAMNGGMNGGMNGNAQAQYQQQLNLMQQQQSQQQGSGGR